MWCRGIRGTGGSKTVNLPRTLCGDASQCRNASLQVVQARARQDDVTSQIDVFVMGRCSARPCHHMMASLFQLLTLKVPRGRGVRMSGLNRNGATCQVTQLTRP